MGDLPGALTHTCSTLLRPTRGGEWTYRREIEEVLFGHPAVASAQVIGVPGERMGEEPVAWVVLRDGAQATARTSARSAASASRT